MAETGEKYSISEQKEIVRLSKDAEKLHLMADVIKELKQDLRQEPDLEWQHFAVVHPHIKGLKTTGYTLLENDFNKYKAARQAVNYWQTQVTTNPENINVLTQQLHLSDSIKIQSADIAFVNDVCIIRLDNEDIKTLFNNETRAISYEEDTSKPHRNIQGMVFNKTLKDAQGNQCPVLIVPKKDDQSILDHEREHATYMQYYLRKNMAQEEQAEPVRDSITRQLTEALHNLPPAEQIKKLRKLLKTSLAEIRGTLFYNEIVANAAGGQEWFDLTALQTRLPEQGSLTLNHSYAPFVADVLNGFTEYTKILSLSPEDKIRLAFEIHNEFAVFEDQNMIIQSWLQELKEQSPDRETLVATLETLPLTRLWTIGYLINKDPEELRQQLYTFTEDQIDDQKQRAFWRLFISNTSLDQQSLRNQAKEIQNRLTIAMNQVAFNDFGVFREHVLPQIYGAAELPDQNSFTNQLEHMYRLYLGYGIFLPNFIESLKFTAFKNLMGLDIDAQVLSYLTQQGKNSGESYTVWAQYLVAWRHYFDTQQNPDISPA